MITTVLNNQIVCFGMNIWLRVGGIAKEKNKNEKKDELSVYVGMYLYKNSKCHLVSFGIKSEADWT